MSDLVRRGIRRYREDGAREFLWAVGGFLRRKARSARNRVKNPIYSLTDRHRLTDPEDVYDAGYYEKRQDDPRRSDAHEVARVLDEGIEPDSVIDFGCAIGHYLEHFHDRGATVDGVEGNSDALEYAVIPEESIDVADLRDPYPVDRNYDLAICFEVAEHLAEQHATTLVDTVTDAADVVAWTAATPGQGGQHHVNEQPREYWIDLFEQRGFEYDAEATEGMREEMSLDSVHEIRENIFVFRR